MFVLLIGFVVQKRSTCPQMFTNWFVQKESWVFRVIQPEATVWNTLLWRQKSENIDSYYHGEREGVPDVF